MKLAVTAFVVTVAAGFAADSFFHSWNWPDAGAIFAVAVMGTFLLWSNRQKNKPD
ncbi:hypothetical protein [Oscillibacter sp. 1-3]|uniref:hypothetical protein n=1 Tax=Oscillibacter sp. 1-3 TaxID=1235797 RepID=UPI00034043B7|nr:hypothetical protein [Oscillibacter sp. 1-3]EOS64980.1 hypothetical protein C816_02708 [Oscillibacter sp. 1-3]MCI9511069.1 hypothetical protein [Oscillibacter sp.]